jgi:transcriptional regulator with XRE-family HTH domain
MTFNYQKICSELIKDLPSRTQDVILRRFGIRKGEKETLESIGRSYGVTRERIRQIEADGLSKLKPKIKDYQRIFQHFDDSIKDFGDLKKEDILLSHLGGQKFNPHVFFLLNLSEEIERFSENKDLYSLWTINPNSLGIAQKVIEDFYNKLKEKKKPLSYGEYSPPFSLKSKAVISYLEISKMIEQSQEGKWGLRDWPEINPRGVKDKAYILLKKEKRPLHFTEVASSISPPALVQTVHNELIRDPRFVLVGRGLYALREWGYKPGTVSDVIVDVLKGSGKPLSKEKILDKVLERRFVKKNTILLNLSNKKYFSRNPQGKYYLKNA